jgi:phage recombination protein Bet
MGLQDAPNGDLAVFLHVCQKTGLDPFARQIHMIGRWDSKAQTKRWTIQTGIDGLRVIAQRTGEFRGRVGPWWCGDDGVWRDVWLSATPPVGARVGVLRYGWPDPVFAVAVWGEYAQVRDGKPVALWAAKPAHMLAKVAEALALRAAFPQDMASVYTDDEIPHPQQQSPVAATTVEVTSGSDIPAGSDSVTSERAPLLITDPQMRKLRAALRDYQTAVGLRLDRDESRDFISGLAGRELGSANDLTRDEASLVIDRLGELVAAAQAIGDGEADQEGPVDAEIVDEVTP